MTDFGEGQVIYIIRYKCLCISIALEVKKGNTILFKPILSFLLLQLSKLTVCFSPGPGAQASLQARVRESVSH